MVVFQCYKLFFKFPSHLERGNSLVDDVRLPVLEPFDGLQELSL